MELNAELPKFAMIWNYPVSTGFDFMNPIQREKIQKEEKLKKFKLKLKKTYHIQN